MLLNRRLREALLEAISQLLRRLLTEGSEARQHRVLLHELDQRYKRHTSDFCARGRARRARTNDAVAVLPRGLKALFEEPPELLEGCPFEAAEHLDVLERELERRGLEADIPRRVRQHEAKVDVDQVPIAVDQDVAVVPVLDLQQVCDDGVS